MGGVNVDLTVLRDRLITRCTYDGAWVYGRQPCPCCGRTDRPSLDEAPRRPNVGRRAA